MKKIVTTLYFTIGKISLGKKEQFFFFYLESKILVCEQFLRQDRWRRIHTSTVVCSYEILHNLIRVSLGFL